MPVITKEQRKALKRIYDRCPIYKGGAAQQLAMNAGWTFVKVEDLPDNLKEAVSPRWQYVWIHDRLSPQRMFADATDIVEAYKLSERLTYRQFRKTIAFGHDCLMVAWQGMWLGVEKDGYTHS